MTSSKSNGHPVTLRGSGLVTGAAGPPDLLDILDPMALAAALRRAHEGHPVLIAAELGIAGRRVTRPADSEEIAELVAMPTRAWVHGEASHAVAKARDWRRTALDHVEFRELQRRRGVNPMSGFDIPLSAAQRQRPLRGY